MTLTEVTSGLSAGPLCAFLSSFTWAVGSSGYSRLARTHSAFAINFARATVALPLFILAVFVTSGGWEAGLQAYSAVRPAHLGWFSLSMLASYGLGDVFFLWSTRSLGVPGALAISSAYPLWTALAGYFFQGEALSALQFFGLILTVIGIVLVILSGTKERPASGSEGAPNPIGLGVLLALGTSVMWAANSFSVAHAGRDLAAPVGNSIRMVIALILSASFGRIFLPGKGVTLPWAEYKRSAWLFGVEAFGGSYFFMYGLSHSTLAIASTLSSLAPVISVPVAWALKLEKFSFFRTLGVCIVMAGIWLLVGGF